MAFLFDGFPEANLSVRRYALANVDGYCQHVLQMDSVLKCMEVPVLSYLHQNHF